MTHDLVDAVTLGERVVVIKDPVIQQVGRTARLYNELAKAAGLYRVTSHELRDDRTAGKNMAGTELLLQRTQRFECWLAEDEPPNGGNQNQFDYEQAAKIDRTWAGTALRLGIHRGDIMRVVICGGGVIGACTAYFLARRGIDVIVVERTEVAAAASGKAGGFLALDWCAGTPLDALARRSFQLHTILPHEIAGDWAYQRTTAYSGTVVSGRDHRRNLLAKLDWLSDGVIIANRLGTPDTTAIVHPHKFTSAIMSAAQRNGAQLCLARVTGMTRSADGSRTRGVEVDGRVVEADAVVIAMGPWSLLAAHWMVLPAIFGQRSPSVVYDTGTDIPPEALFLDYHEDDGSVSTAEVFPRADGSTHVTAFSEIVALPLDPGTITPDADAIDRLEGICERLSPVFRAERIIARQACFRPVTEDGLPLIGKVPQLDGAYVATGHNVWGILNAPATGEALAELIGDGVVRTVDLTAFDPTRLRRLNPSLLRSS